MKILLVCWDCRVGSGQRNFILKIFRLYFRRYFNTIKILHRIYQSFSEAQWGNEIHSISMGYKLYKLFILSAKHTCKSRCCPFVCPYVAMLKTSWHDKGWHDDMMAGSFGDDWPYSTFLKVMRIFLKQWVIWAKALEIFHRHFNQ